MHSTNYFNTFILIADDSPTAEGEMPPLKGEKKSVANLQFEMLYEQPYEFTSDDVLYGVFSQRKGFDQSEIEAERIKYFSKGQPCFRASPLTKRYGWGVHANAEGKIAIYASGSSEYEALMNDDAVQKIKAMRNKKA